MVAWLDGLLRRGPEIEWVDTDGLHQRLTEPHPPLVIDVRGPDEFDGPLGHIEGARNIPLPALAAETGTLTGLARPIVLVCLTDVRSSRAAVELKSAGIHDVSVLRGGMKAWRGAPG